MPVWERWVPLLHITKNISGRVRNGAPAAEPRAADIAEIELEVYHDPRNLSYKALAFLFATGEATPVRISHFGDLEIQYDGTVTRHHQPPPQAGMPIMEYFTISVKNCRARTLQEQDR